MEINGKAWQERYKIPVIAVLCGICCYFTYYFHAVLEYGGIFAHFFYVPVILAVLWWGKKGLVVPVFWGAFLILSHIFIREHYAGIINDYARACMLIVIGFVCAVLSERVTKTTKLKREKRFSEEIINALPEFLAVIDKNLRITNVSRDFYGTFQIDKDRDNVTGPRLTDILGDRDRSLSVELNRLFKTGKVLESFELSYPPDGDPDKRIFNVMARGMRSGETEEAQHVVVVLQDITARKKIERSQRLIQLGKLVADMAHEINNPLMVISGNAQLALMEKTDNKELKKCLEIIFAQTRRTKDIIERLLKFAKPGTGTRKRSDINMIVNTVVSIMEKQYTVKGVTIKRKLAGDLPPALIDEKAIQEVLMALLTNAFEAISGNGVIEFHTFHKDDLIRVDIKDTGSGIVEKNMDKIFEPFFTTKEEGTGLGISICQTIIKNHGGELKLKSAPDKGTTATILLPVYKGVDNSP